jgi:hypothetical protein
MLTPMLSTEPFLDNPSLVELGNIQLKKIYSLMDICCHEGMHIIDNNVQLSRGIQMLLHLYQVAQCVT